MSRGFKHGQDKAWEEGAESGRTGEGGGAKNENNRAQLPKAGSHVQHHVAISYGDGDSFVIDIHLPVLTKIEKLKEMLQKAQSESELSTLRTAELLLSVSRKINKKMHGGKSEQDMSRLGLFVEPKVCPSLEVREGETSPSLNDQMDAFLDMENPKKILLLLGDAGSGKSWSVRHFWERKWGEYEPPKPNAEPSPIPLLIELPKYSSIEYGNEPGGLIYAYLADLMGEYHLTLNEIRAILTQPLICLLDSYDEMSLYTDNGGKFTHPNLYVKNKFQDWKEGGPLKIITACRSQMLLQLSGDYKEYFFPQNEKGYCPRLFEQWVIRPFDSDQIDKYIDLYISKKQKESMKNRVGQSRTQGYIRHPVAANGDCGYTAFGITRDEALSQLLSHLEPIKGLLQPAIQEALVTDRFYRYLVANNVIKSDVTHESVIENSELYLTTAVYRLYLTYDVQEKKIDTGYAHPGVLQALAHIRGIALRIWRLGENGALRPNRGEHFDCFEYIPPDVDEPRPVNILFVNNNHFELLESSESSHRVSAGDMPTYPLNSSGAQQKELNIKNWSKQQYKKLKNIAGLYELIGNPFLLYITLEVLPNLSESKSISKLTLYQAYVKRHFNRVSINLKREKRVSENVDIEGAFLKFSEELARTLFRWGKDDFHYYKTKSVPRNKINRKMSELTSELKGMFGEGCDLFLLRTKRDPSSIDIEEWRFNGNIPALIEHDRGNDKDYYIYGMGEEDTLISMCEELTASQLKSINNLNFYDNKVVVSKRLRSALFELLKKYHQQLEIKTIQFGCMLRALGGDRYTFIHKSLMEYFLSGLIVDELVKLGNPTCFQNLASSDQKNILNMRLLHEEFGVLEFTVKRLQQQEEDSRNALIKSLYNVVKSSREPDFSDDVDRDGHNATLYPYLGRNVQAAAANAIIILNNMGEQFHHKDFRGIQISGADLTGAWCQSTNFSGADLSEVCFKNAWLHKANLTNANFKGVEFGVKPSLKYSGSSGDHPETFAIEPYQAQGAKGWLTAHGDGFLRTWVDGQCVDKSPLPVKDSNTSKTSAVNFHRRGHIFCSIEGMSLSEDAETRVCIAVAKSTGIIQIWRLKEGVWRIDDEIREDRDRKIRNYRTSSMVSLSRDGNVIVTLTEDRSCFTSWEFDGKKWLKGKEQKIFENSCPGGAVWVTFIDNDQFFIAAHLAIPSSRLWSRTGKEGLWKKVIFSENDGAITSATLFKDGETLITAHYGGACYMWRMKKGKGWCKAKMIIKGDGSSLDIIGLALSADEKNLAFVKELLFSGESGYICRILTLKERWSASRVTSNVSLLSKNTSDQIEAVSSSEDGNIIMVSSDETLRIIGRRDGHWREIQRLTKEYSLHALASVSGNGRYVIGKKLYQKDSESDEWLVNEREIPNCLGTIAEMMRGSGAVVNEDILARSISRDGNSLVTVYEVNYKVNLEPRGMDAKLSEVHDHSHYDQLFLFDLLRKSNGHWTRDLFARTLSRFDSVIFSGSSPKVKIKVLESSCFPSFLLSDMERGVELYGSVNFVDFSSSGNGALFALTLMVNGMFYCMILDRALQEVGLLELGKSIGSVEMAPYGLVKSVSLSSSGQLLAIAMGNACHIWSVVNGKKFQPLQTIRHVNARKLASVQIINETEHSIDFKVVISTRYRIFIWQVFGESYEYKLCSIIGDSKLELQMVNINGCESISHENLFLLREKRGKSSNDQPENTFEKKGGGGEKETASTHDFDTSKPNPPERAKSSTTKKYQPQEGRFNGWLIGAIFSGMKRIGLGGAAVAVATLAAVIFYVVKYRKDGPKQLRQSLEERFHSALAFFGQPRGGGNKELVPLT